MRGIIITAAVLAAFAALPLPSRAQEAAIPPLRAMKPFKDKGGFVAIDLPQNWYEVPEERKGRLLAVWRGWYQDKTAENPNPEQQIVLSVEPAFCQANMLLRFAGLEDTILEGSLKRGKDWVEVWREDGDTFVWTRMYSTRHGVFAFEVTHHRLMHPYLEGHTRQVLDTIKLMGPVPDHPLPEGYRVVDGDGIEIWTNGTASKAVRDAVAEFRTGWEAARTLSEGEPFADIPPRMIFCKDAGTYTSMYEEAYKAAMPPVGGFDNPDRWAAVMSLEDLSKKGNKEIEGLAMRYGGVCYLRRHYGGLLPAWIEWGLSLRAQLEPVKKGKFGKPSKNDVKRAKDAFAKRGTTLAGILALGSQDARSGPDDAPYELWAWVHFLSEVQKGELAGDAYRQYLRTLKETGDPVEAAKAFDGVGRETVDVLFKAWIDGWR